MSSDSDDDSIISLYPPARRRKRQPASLNYNSIFNSVRLDLPSDLEPAEDGHNGDEVSRITLSDDDTQANEGGCDICGEETEDDTTSHRKTRSKTRAATGYPHNPFSDHPSIEDEIADLADTLEELESLGDLVRLYPPKFSKGRPQTKTIPESEILKEFIATDDNDQETMDETDFNEFILIDFFVYRSPSPTHPKGLEGQYDSLHVVASAYNKAHWLVDGVLQHNGVLRPLSSARIAEVSIGALEDLEEHTTVNQIWIMTVESQTHNPRKPYWYRLKTPFHAYASYWTDFVWLADFTKHFIDFLHVHMNSGVSVHLSDFKSKFSKWLQGLHGEKLKGWRQICKDREDFRHDITRYVQFLHDQTSSLCDKNNPRLSHSIWGEIGASPISLDQERPSTLEKTIVTPNVAKSFSQFLFWSDFELLETIELSPEVKARREMRMKEENFFDKFKYAESKDFRLERGGKNMISKAAWLLEDAELESPVVVDHSEDLLRKVVIVRKQSQQTGQYEFSYAWVRHVSRSTLYVAWLVLPSETICGDDAFYPIGNELFFSCQCNCEGVSVRDVVKVLNASVFTDHATAGSDLFVCFLAKMDDCIIQANEAELNCGCKMPRKRSPNRRQQHSILKEDYPQMQCLGLFSGCGLFEHAFVSPGYALVALAIEHSEAAALSYRANDASGRTRCEIGSVNVWIRKFASGEEKMIHINCIIAGPPCPGFSQLNTFRGNEKGQKNCSLLANTLSWVEIFMPAYALIENVPNMDSGRPNACSQAVCYLSALGYQVRKSKCVDSDVGGASRRERLFIVAAAKGYELPGHLRRTHGPAGSGLIPIRTFRHCTDDLDPVQNDTILNPANPNHVPLKRMKIDHRVGVNYRALLQKIPTDPPQMSLSKVYHHYRKRLTREEIALVEELPGERRRRESKCLQRLHPDRPFRTITCRIVPMDGRSAGEVLHPFEDRLISLEETGRGMSIPRSFVLVGTVRKLHGENAVPSYSIGMETVTKQHKQLGNGVPWPMGAGWGREFGRKWISSLEKRKGKDRQMGDVDDRFKSGVEVGSKSDIKPPFKVNIKRENHLSDAEFRGGRPTPPVKRRAHPISLPDHSDSDSSVEIVAERPVKRTRSQRSDLKR